MIKGGIVRQLDLLGRVVIPMEIRRNFDINERDPIEFLVDDGGKIVLRKYERGCIFCSEVKGIINFKGKNICKNCIEEL